MDIELSQPLESVTITWRCDGCGVAIEDGAGYIEIDSAAAQQQALERRQWHRENDGKMLSLSEIPVPRPVPWRAWHRACDPDPDGGEYWFDVERIRNMAQFLDFYGHVSGKTWHSSTTLRDIRALFGNVYGLC